MGVITLILAPRFGNSYYYSSSPPLPPPPPLEDESYYTTNPMYSSEEESLPVAKKRCNFEVLKRREETLAVLKKKRYPNKPIVEFEIAAQEQMKITELRLTKLYFPMLSSSPSVKSTSLAAKAGEDRVSIIGSHLTAGSEAFNAISAHGPSRTRPPITTHVLDVSRGSPAAGIEVKLEKWKGSQPSPSFSEASDSGGAWVYQRTSSTDNDGRSGHLMEVVDNVEPGIYRMSFNTGKYCPDGFFPYVSIVFEIKESQKMQHFHVPLLFSPFSLTTYRGS
ncbi:hypothetical protein GIB67_034141 [Kingdonia uniflora]|uniref:hydroxyisourate hydrolase n=1 Tax=Kingdonia uniflora TaxID=39325 RepID=A0A7J7P5H9_9MAGN|nr:hypothetical protein GIB67_034141 [Kingdonia uniflora]